MPSWVKPPGSAIYRPNTTLVDPRARWFWQQPVAAWAMGHPGGLEIPDALGRFPATMVNMERADWDTDQYGLGLKFGGTDERATHSARVVNLTAFSILVCFRTTQATSGALYFEANTGTLLQMGGLRISDAVAGDVEFVNRDDAAATGTIAPGDLNMDDGQLHVVAGVQNSLSSRRLFVDGRERGTNTSTLGTRTIDAGRIGNRRRIAEESHFVGTIYYVMVYNRALTVDEVRVLTLDPFLAFRSRRAVGVGLTAAGTLNVEDSDSGTLSEAALILAVATDSETGTFAEAQATLAVAAGSDTGTLSEATALPAVVTGNDSGTVTEVGAALAVGDGADSATLAELVALLGVPVASETGTVTDTAIVGAVAQQSESGTFNEAIEALIAASGTETGTLSELAQVVAVLVGTETYTLDVESAALVESGGVTLSGTLLGTLESEGRMEGTASAVSRSSGTAGTGGRLSGTGHTGV